MSASLPGASSPFWVMPKMRAGAVLLSATKRSGVMRPLFTPKCQRICRRFSMPGPPLGIFGKVVPAEGFLIRKAKGAVVGGDDGEGVIGKRVPKGLLIAFFRAAGV